MIPTTLPNANQTAAEAAAKQVISSYRSALSNFANTIRGGVVALHLNRDPNAVIAAIEAANGPGSSGFLFDKTAEALAFITQHQLGEDLVTPITKLMKPFTRGADGIITFTDPPLPMPAATRVTPAQVVGSTVG